LSRRLVRQSRLATAETDGQRDKGKVALARRLRQEMPMKLKMDCQTIQQGCGGFPGEPSARSAQQTKICGNAGLTRL